MQLSKYSKQRELLLSILKERKDHPTADELYMSLREQVPNISLGTVYRNLALLSTGGTIQKITSPDSADRFDYNAEAHYHFLCTHCGAVIDVDMPLQNEIDDQTAALLNAQVEGHSTLFYGKCSACLQPQSS